MSTAFDKLAQPIQKWIRQQGWKELRDIQTRATHVLIDGNTDLIITASTAGGKTEAAFLPLLSQVLDNPHKKSGFDILYIAPLKALITDQARRLEDICRETDIPIMLWHGDVSSSIKTRATKQPKGVLLITPESLEALFIHRGLEIPRLFGATRAVILDELHSILSSERGIQIRSLLTRLEIAIRRPIRRIGLSATLGDMELAKAYLRPDSPNDVEQINVEGRSTELQLQLRGYAAGDKEDEEPSATDVIAQHIFEHLRGSDNLVFAGARQAVEIYSDQLRMLSEKEHLPQEFYPHHASLSREHRDFVERRLKDSNSPTTAVCTSTLELGIDIGDVTCVGQIGAPFSVASLRQRLGRSGRRAGKPAILRQYAIEAKLTPTSHFSDRLRLGMVRAIAMIELLLEGWCEPPQREALHLSTLVHQILSVIAEREGIRARQLYGILCQNGPFRQVDTQLFLEVLRVLGHSEVMLIEQAGNGLLLLGKMGEKLVEHYSFYTAFQTPEEYRLISSGKELGTLPINNMIVPGMLIIFLGRRWLVQEVLDRDRVIMIAPAKAGSSPIFGGDPGSIHDRVIERMFEILKGQQRPIYLDAMALELLDEARVNFAQLRFGPGRIVQFGDDTAVLATKAGSVQTTTLALALRASGYTVEPYDGFLEVHGKDEIPPIVDTLSLLASGKNVDLFAHSPNLLFEKFHSYLPENLLQRDALSARLDVSALPDLCRSILENA